MGWDCDPPSVNSSSFKAGKLVRLPVTFLVSCALACPFAFAFADAPKQKTTAAAESSEKAETATSAEKTEKTEVAEDELALEEAEAAAVARPVSSDPVQVYGWREMVLIDGMKAPMIGKLDTGALTSSIHAEEQVLFERDGKKWVRFIVTDARKKDAPRVRLEAPLTRVARIKEPGGKSENRHVVMLNFKIGDRKLRGDFTLNNRVNMLAPVLIGRTMLKELGWVDPNRTNLAGENIMR